MVLLLLSTLVTFEVEVRLKSNEMVPASIWEQTLAFQMFAIADYFKSRLDTQKHQPDAPLFEVDAQYSAYQPYYAPGCHWGQ